MFFERILYFGYNMKVMFWNMNNQTSNIELIKLIGKYKPDCVLVAESKICLEETILELKYDYVSSIIHNKPKISFIYNSQTISEAKILQEHKNRLFAYSIKYESLEFMIIGVHFVSKLNFDKDSQLCECIDYMEQVRSLETNHNCKNTIIIGDFNMNPFDIGMIAGNAFNSVVSEAIAMKGKRIIQRKEYEYFYNPSWKIYGGAEKVFGTYYLKNPDHSSFHWNIYDQVLVRPTVLLENNVNYCVITDNACFSTEKKAASDHSPIYAEIERRK